MQKIPSVPADITDAHYRAVLSAIRERMNTPSMRQIPAIPPNIDTHKRMVLSAIRNAIHAKSGDISALPAGLSVQERAFLSAVRSNINNGFYGG